MNLNIFHLFHGVGARGKGGYTPLPKAWKGGVVCRTMVLLLPFFGKHLENAVFLAWKAKSIIKAKEKRSCLKPNDICFFIFCHFWKPQLSTYWGCPPPPSTSFMSSQKACPSLYHQLIRLCFYKIVRRNIHFSVSSHSLCNRTVILFAVMNGVKLHITFIVI